MAHTALLQSLVSAVAAADPDIPPPLPAPTGPAAGIHGGHDAPRRRLPGGHRAPSAARRSPGSGPRLLAGPACVCRCLEALWGGQLGGVASLFSFPLGWW